MRVAMDTVIASGNLRASIVHRSILNPERAKYDLKYYVNLAGNPGRRRACFWSGHGRAFEASRRAVLVKALKEETGLPIHFHTHAPRVWRCQHSCSGRAGEAQWMWRWMPFQVERRSLALGQSLRHCIDQRWIPADINAIRH